MALKNLSVLDRPVRSYAGEGQQEFDRRGSNTQISGDAFFNEHGLPFLEEQPHASIQHEPFHDDHYQIALVPRWHQTGQRGSILEAAPKMDRVFLLPLTWRELLDRLRRALGHSSSVEESAMARFGA